MNLSVEQFNPTKAELTKLADQYGSISIEGVDDIAGYNEANEAKKHLVSVRRKIQDKGKEMRSDALSFQRQVIALEKT